MTQTLQSTAAQEPAQVPLDKFEALKSQFTEVSVNALGGKVLSASDEFFVPKENLIKPEVSVPVAAKATSR